MKIKVFFFLLLVIGKNIKAQTNQYHPFPETNAIWNVKIQNLCISPSNYCEENYSYILRGDTVISGLTYHKLFVPGILKKGALSCSSCDGFEPVGYVGLIRQDISAKKVYYIEPLTIQEQLLYDFNMQVGDTVKGYYENFKACQFHPDIVSEIDSVLVGNNYRKRWFFNSGHYTSIIEGIGTTVGIGNYNQFLGQSDCGFIDEAPIMLTCFRQNDTILYAKQGTLDCNVITAIKEPKLEKLSVSFYPNPFHEFANLHFNYHFENSKLLIFNMQGKKIREESIINSTYKVLRGQLQAGNYYYWIISNTGQITYGKFVIE